MADEKVPVPNATATRTEAAVTPPQSLPPSERLLPVDQVPLVPTDLEPGPYSLLNDRWVAGDLPGAYPPSPYHFV